MSSARRAAWLVAASIGLAVPQHARAGDSERLRVVVRVASERDRALLGRVRGHSADLDLDLLATETGAIEPRLGDQLDAAAALAQAQGASVVVWADAGATPGEVLVIVYVPASGRVLVRRLGSAGAAPTSSTLESAALVVRGALRALAQGAVIGVQREDLSAGEPSSAPQAHSPPVAPPAPRAIEQRAAEPIATSRTTPRRARTRSFGWVLSGGWQFAIDGLSRATQQGPALRGGILFDSWEISLALSTALPADLSGEGWVVHLSRHSAGIYAGLHIELLRDLNLGVGVLAGAVTFVRSTSTSSPGVEPSPTRWTFSPLLAAEVRASWLRRVGGGCVGLVLALGTDVVPGAPRFGIEVFGGSEPGAIVPVFDAWLLQPRASLSIELTLR